VKDVFAILLVLIMCLGGVSIFIGALNKINPDGAEVLPRKQTELTFREMCDSVKGKTAFNGKVWVCLK